MRTLAMLLWLVLSSIALADLDVSVVKSRVITGLANPRVLGEVVLYDGDQKPKVTPAAMITVVSDYKFVRVKARTSLFEASPLQKISEGEYLLTGAGKYAVEVTAFDPEKGIDERVVAVELAEVEPGPDEPDIPDNPDVPDNPDTPVPPDPFDNIGQRVAKAVAGADKRAEVAQFYKDGAKDLLENQSVTINGVFDTIFNKRAALVGNDPKWKAFSDLLGADVRARWPMSRLGLSEYFKAVAAGLEAK